MIKLNNISKKYNNQEILKNINYDFASTGLYIIYGKNGVGKTTLLQIIGLLDSDYEGDLIIENQNMKEMSDKKRTKYRNVNISYVFSKGNLVPYLNVEENLKLAVDNVSQKFIDLPMKQDVNTLSGGEEILLALSREFSLNKKIYLFDEISSSLDNKNVEKLKEILTEFSKEHLLILVTHDLRFKNFGEKIEIL